MTEILELHDSATNSRARIAASQGFNLFEFRADVDGTLFDVIDASADFADGGQRPSGHGIPLLFPFPNRIHHGEFDWAGQHYAMSPEQVSFDRDGNAIHGFCLDRPWRVIDQGADFALAQFQLSQDAPDRRALWPADFLIEARYTLQSASLVLDLRIANPDTQPLPWGFGTHPYFCVPLSPTSRPEQCLIEALAAMAWELDNCLPTGVRSPVTARQDLRDGQYFGQFSMDDVLSGLPTDTDRIVCRIVDEHAGLQVTQSYSPVFQELVVFTPPGRNAVCLEPYTCVTDAVNLSSRLSETGWRVLEPGQEFRANIIISAGLVVA